MPKRLPRSPEEEHQRWLLPGSPKRPAPPPVPQEVRRDPRQHSMPLEKTEEKKESAQ
jgi:hypothetical protein